MNYYEEKYVLPYAGLKLVISVILGLKWLCCCQKKKIKIKQLKLAGFYFISMNVLVPPLFLRVRWDDVWPWYFSQSEIIVLILSLLNDALGMAFALASSHSSFELGCGCWARLLQPELVPPPDNGESRGESQLIHLIPRVPSSRLFLKTHWMRRSEVQPLQTFSSNHIALHCQDLPRRYQELANENKAVELATKTIGLGRDPEDENLFFLALVKYNCFSQYSNQLEKKWMLMYSYF